MVQTLWDSITEFLSPEAGQRRRAALDQFGRDVEYYVPPEMRGLLGFAAEMTPSATIDRAAQAGGEMMAPGRTPMERVGSAGRMLSETAGVVAPMMVAPRAGMTAAQAVQEGLLGASVAGQGAADAGRMFLADEAGAMRLWHGSPYDFDTFDLAKVGSGEGAQDLGRGFSLTDEEAISHLYTNPASRWGDLQAMRRYSEAGPGRYYDVNVNADPEQFLDWKKPWREQVPEGTPLYDALVGREQEMLRVYGDDPSMVAAIPKATVSNMWRDQRGFEDAAMRSGFVGNLRKNFGGDTEYTVFDPALMNIERKFDKDGNLLTSSLPAPRNDAEAMARDILEMRAAGRAGDVTDEMMAQADPQYMFANTPLPMDEASRMARAAGRRDEFHGTTTGSDMTYADAFRGSGSRQGIGFVTSDNPYVASSYADPAFGSVFPMLNEPPPVNAPRLDVGGEIWSQIPKDLPVQVGDRVITARDVAVEPADVGGVFDTNQLSRGASFDYPAIEFSNISDRSIHAPRPRTDDGMEVMREFQAKGAEPSTVTMRHDTRGMRSRFARFDPEFRHLRNLSAGVAGGGLLATQDEQQQREDEIRQYLGGLL